MGVFGQPLWEGALCDRTGFGAKDAKKISDRRRVCRIMDPGSDE
jgi:hypothetical protein